MHQRTNTKKRLIYLQALANFTLLDSHRVSLRADYEYESGPNKRTPLKVKSLTSNSWSQDVTKAVFEPLSP